MFLVVIQDRDNQFAGDTARAADEIQMAVGERVERPGIYGDNAVGASGWQEPLYQRFLLSNWLTWYERAAASPPLVDDATKLP